MAAATSASAQPGESGGYAHSQIMREDSPIENVVIDLSNNVGGAAPAAVCVISWYLGDAVLNLNNTLTEGQASLR